MRARMTSLQDRPTAVRQQTRRSTASALGQDEKSAGTQAGRENADLDVTSCADWFLAEREREWKNGG